MGSIDPEVSSLSRVNLDRGRLTRSALLLTVVAHHCNCSSGKQSMGSQTVQIYGPCRYVVIRQYGHFTETLFFDLLATKGEKPERVHPIDSTCSPSSITM